MVKNMTPVRVHTGSRSLHAQGNTACESKGIKPKGRGNHRNEPGEGTLGGVHASEPLTRPREGRLPEMVVNKDGNTGSRPQVPERLSKAAAQPLLGHQDPGGEKAPTPNASPQVRHVVPPLRSGSARQPDDLRKDGPIPQGAQEGPRSDGYRPRGTGNPSPGG